MPMGSDTSEPFCALKVGVVDKGPTCKAYERVEKWVGRL